MVSRRCTKIRPKAVGGGIFGRFSNFEKCRSEAADDIMSNVAVDYVGVDVRSKFGDSMLNGGLIIRLFSGRIGLTYFCAVFNGIL